MHILHVVPTYFPAVRYGGPIWSVHALCRALVLRGHQVSVATTSVDGPDNIDAPSDRPVDLDGVSVSYFPSNHLRRLYWSPPLARHLREVIKNVDFLHIHSVFLWPTSAAARVAELNSVPWCVAPRGALVPALVQQRNRWIKMAWLSLIEKRTLEGAAFIHATSELEAADVGGFGLHLPPISVVPNGVDLPGLIDADEVAAALPIAPPSGPLLLFLGRVNWKKGLDRLIPALAQVPFAQLVIAGNDEEGLTPHLQQLAHDAGVASRVFFIGPVQGKAKDALLRTATLLVLPSYNENFGNVVLESLACGRPVAVTAAVGVAPIVVAANAGVVVPDEPVAMGLALAALVASPERLDEMGRNGQQLVSSSYSWDAIAQRMEVAYAEARESISLRQHR
jgi:glycosyltransferase involved in cell wall biosynthesis